MVKRKEDAKFTYEDITQQLKIELTNFDLNKVQDFQSSMDLFLDSIIDSQEHVKFL